MNIFAVSVDYMLCARALDDKRLNKMTLETAQLLSSAIKINGGIATYKATHLKHPCTIWTASSRANYTWLFFYFKELTHEYEFRFNKVHACSKLTQEFYNNIHIIPDGQLTEFANCTVNKEKNISFKHLTDATQAYKEYLNARWKTDKLIPKWTNRGKPEWHYEK